MNCPITLEPINRVAELTTCGHAFEYEAILTHYHVGTSRCPVCRTPFTLFDIYCSRNLQNYMHRVEVSTQTEPTAVQNVWATITQYLNYVDNSVRNVAAALMVNRQPAFTVGHNDCFRVVEPDSFINPTSSTIRDEQSIIALNERFYDGNPIKLNRFVYQTQSNDVKSVARTLALTGYFVYDLFAINRGPLYRYVLYSKDNKLSGTPVTLSKYRRFSTRLG